MSRLERWSRRKLREDTESSDASDISNIRDEALTEDVDAAHQDAVAESEIDSTGEPPAPGSLDATLPDPESLAPGSDIKAFLEPGVSRGLRRRALRRLFAGEQYGVRDGLDDYDHDYREKLKPLASELAQRMRQWTTSSEEAREEDVVQEFADDEIPSSQVQYGERQEENAETGDEPSPDEANSATSEDPRFGDASMLDQGRVGTRRQSDQD